MSDDEAPPPTVNDFLRGKAVLIPLAVVTPVELDGAVTWARVENPAGGGDLIEQVGIRFDANVLSEMEDAWGSMQGWMGMSQRKPVKTARDTIAIALGREPKAVGVAMLDSEGHRYTVALGSAFAIANGVDPQTAVTAVEKAVAAYIDPTTRIVQTSDIPSGTGSPDGSDPAPPGSDAPTTSSGG